MVSSVDPIESFRFCCHHFSQGRCKVVRSVDPFECSWWFALATVIRSTGFTFSGATSYSSNSMKGTFMRGAEEKPLVQGGTKMPRPLGSQMESSP